MSAEVVSSRPRRAYPVAFARVLATFLAAAGSGQAAAVQREYENEAVLTGAAANVPPPPPVDLKLLTDEPMRPLSCHDGQCNGHGKCLDGACECQPHWAGDHCSQFLVEDASQECMDPSCGGHGRCDVGLCRCDMGWSGATCEIEAVCASWCNSPGGTCQNGFCSCNPGWGGPSCGERTCEHQCWGHGVCDNGHCICNDSWEGNECEVRKLAVGFAESPWEIPGLTAVKQAPTPAYGPGPAPGPIEFLPGSIFGWTGPGPAPPPIQQGFFGTPLAQPGFQIAQPMEQVPLPAIPPPVQVTPVLAQENPELVLLEQESEASRRQSPFVLTKNMLSGGMHRRLPAQPVIRPVYSQPEMMPRSALSGESSAESAQGTSLWNGVATSAMHQVQSALSAAERAIAAAGALERAGSMDTAARSQMVRMRIDPKLDKRVFPSPPKAAATPKPAAMAVGTTPIPAGMCLEDCSGHGSCADSTCECGDGWSGEACDIEPCLNGCNGRGACLQGSCVCNAAFYGMSCEFSRCKNDCHGNGFCVEGKCSCQASWVGETCDEEMKVIAAPEKAIPTMNKPMGLNKALQGFMGKMPAVCPEECNGNGKCNNIGACDCFPGYTGPACNNFCPNLCSGQGKCTDGRCLCLAGFIGVDCSIKACCSGHGDCTIPGTCICGPGWMGAQCEVGMQCPDPKCSGHGACTDGTCACTAGFSGVTCATEPQECGPCPPGGECDRESGTCLCGGAPCKKMMKASAKKGGGSKGGGGAGGAGGGAGVAGSVGGPGFGMDVDPDAPIVDDDDDGDGGIVDDGGGLSGNKPKKAKALKAPAVKAVVLHPSCSPPDGHWNGTVGACDCEHSFFGEHCENKHCADWDEELNPFDCTKHGMCVKGECFCAAGWGLKPGAVGANVCLDPVCPVDCGPHGMCQDNLCVCQDGWQGPACREPKCIDDCSGHGTCTFTTANSPAECVCEYGFTQPNCLNLALYQKLNKCPNECSGNGLCMDGACVCMQGTTGIDCSSVVCPPGSNGPNCEYRSCARDCSGYGVCFNGDCTCDNNHMAPDCSIPTKCYDACHAVCLPDLSGSRCEFCKGQCLTLASNPVVGNHNPMLARLYALPQVSGNLLANQTRRPVSAAKFPRRRLHKRHHEEVSAVQTGHHAPRHHHAEVSSVKVGHYMVSV